MANIPTGKLSDLNEQRSRGELAYEWIAKYKDGTELKQYDDKKGLVYHFGHIDQGQICEFVLESKQEPKIRFGVNLETGLFYLNGKELRELWDGQTRIPLGLFLVGKKIVSSWGNKAKLIYFRHVRRNFEMGTGRMSVQITYELGWEAKIDGKHEKYTLLIDEKGRLALPITPEQEGFKAL